MDQVHRLVWKFNRGSAVGRFALLGARRAQLLFDYDRRVAKADTANEAASTAYVPNKLFRDRRCSKPGLRRFGTK